MTARITEREAHALGLVGSKANKYGNERPTFDGIRFDSQLEARYYGELLLRQKAGEIGEIERQVRYALTTNGVKIGEYRCDFRFHDYHLGRQVVVDCKGFANQLYLWKKRHMKAEHGIEIVEVKDRE